MLILHVVTIYRPDESNVLFMLSKPLLMFSLLAFFLHRVGAIRLKAKLLYAVGILFSLIGDVLLMYTTESSFMMGVGAFLIAQLCYAVFFFQNTVGFNWRSAVLALVPIVFGFWFLNQMLELPKPLVLPVNVYGVALSTMLLAAFNYGTKLGRRSFFINLGALFFLVSDLLLAYNKFDAGNKYFSILVLITYAFAQFLLATSVITAAEQDYYKS